ncbi:AraC family transcriptional regulator [Chitinophagaceae bacterium LWZ2-11]
MIKENLYHPFEIDFKDLETFPKVTYKNNFFKLIYVITGTGVQYMNKHRFNYRQGNLFLITPADSYSFDINEKSSFFFLHFNDIYVKTKVNKENDWVQSMEYILQNASHRPGCILKNRVDKPVVASLVDCIRKEYDSEQIYHTKIIQHLVNTLILVVARNIALKLPKNVKENTGEVVLDILHYIQENIFEQENLRTDRISESFNISHNYLGRYFKKQTGETLQQYIGNYKLRLIELRLLNSDMRINEIAYELNFTDESHLNRAFKKYKGLSPSAFRRKFAS